MQSMSDCVAIPGYFDEVPPPQAEKPARPKEWVSSAAALAWGDSKQGAVFVFVENYFEEFAAREAAMKKCTGKGWDNCEIAQSVTNGVIVVARQSDGNLRIRAGDDADRLIGELMANCAKDAIQCKVEKVVDGLPIFM